MSRATLSHRRYRGRWAIAVALLLGWVSVPTAAAQELTGVNVSDAKETFVIGNVVFALMHEFGHALIQEFEVPILGMEENAADTIAAASLVLLDRERPDAGFATVLGSTALAQIFVWESGVEREHGEVLLWAQHGLSAQRFARLVCLLYGSDTERFGWLAEGAEMNDIRAEGCEYEWQVAERAVRWLHDTYGARPGAAGTPFETAYGPARDDDSDAWRQLMVDRRVLERIALGMQETFAFPDDLELKATRCGVPNAYYDADYKEIVLCYELVTAMAALADRPEVQSVIQRLATGEAAPDNR